MVALISCHDIQETRQPDCLTSTYAVSALPPLASAFST